MPTLADIYSAADSFKRRLYDTASNPLTSAQQMLGYAVDRARNLRGDIGQSAQESMQTGEFVTPRDKVMAAQLAESYNPIGMTVYHGSPHVFERFDLGKIGAGTGQQVYGKGLYMAEAPEVAQQYQKNVKDIGLIRSYNEKLSQLNKIMEEDSAYPGAYRKFKSDKGQRAAQEYDALMEARNSLSTNPGNLYKVDLPDTHIRRMLDFDAPLKDQPYPVRNLAKKLGMDMNDLGGDLLEKIGKTEQGREVLQKAGIPGVKYYDQMKGGIDQWKRNFVVFDPNHLTILERNNKPIQQAKPIEDLSYRGSHTAPGPDFGAPLHDLTGGGQMYPSDVYAASASRIYGGGMPYDRKAFDIAQSYKDKPNASVTIYRAVPKELSNSEKLAALEKQMAAYMRRGTLPKDAENYSSGSKWYDWAYEERNKLRDLPDEPMTQIGINPGDWVTLTREYAKDHGESALKGQYKILSKKVKAKDLWTNADSIHEFGYNPSND